MITPHWRWLGGLTILAAFLAGPVFGQEPGDVSKVIKDLQKEIKLLADDVRSLRDHMDELGALKKQVEQLQRDVNSLKTAGRPAFYPPTGTGRIRLVNSFPTQMGVIVNGQFHRLAPNEERVLDNQPVGNFTYEVVGASPPVPGQTWPLTRTLTSSETFTITVYPR
jgi:hypothetical protein